MKYHHHSSCLPLLDQTHRFWKFWNPDHKCYTLPQNLFQFHIHLQIIKVYFDMLLHSFLLRELYAITEITVLNALRIFDHDTRVLTMQYYWRVAINEVVVH